LRAALRNDPDIVMVGEIRDDETAHIALRAAMTGHLVLSTLHTNDALSGAWRLIDMGIEPYLAASAVRLVMAQRLARRICRSCADNYTPTLQEQKWLAFINPGKNNNNINFQKGRGCTQCGMRGYKGRIGLYEMIEISSQMIDALRMRDIQAFNLIVHQSRIYQPLTKSALEYAAKGLISLDEVLRLSAELMDEEK
jgi:MSHA biogenesis protein MshE